MKYLPDTNFSLSAQVTDVREIPIQCSHGGGFGWKRAFLLFFLIPHVHVVVNVFLFSNKNNKKTSTARTTKDLDIMPFCMMLCSYKYALISSSTNEQRTNERKKLSEMRIYFFFFRVPFAKFLLCSLVSLSFLHIFIALFSKCISANLQRTWSVQVNGAVFFSSSE